MQDPTQKQEKKSTPVQIKDYSEDDGESSEKSRKKTLYNFNEIQDMLEQEESNNQVMYIQKINDLQSKYNRILKSNSLLTEKIEELERQLSFVQQNQIQSQKIDDFIGLLQKQLDSYKTQLVQYREKQRQLSKNKDIQIQRLKKTIENFTLQKNEIQFQKSELIDLNNELERKNMDLIQQNESLKEQLMDQKSSSFYSRGQSYKRLNTGRDSSFDSQIQAELQNMIEKLMNELEYERNGKKRLAQQIKRMQEEILFLDKEISNKNHKIYQLQMDNIKSNRLSPKHQKRLQINLQQKPTKITTKYTNNIHQRQGKSSDRNSSIQTFSLEDVINGIVSMTEKQKYILCQKLVHFYIKKITNNDYTPYNPEHLIVNNYKKTNPSALIIRRDNKVNQNNGQISLPNLIWNLGLLLSILLLEGKIEYKNEQEQCLAQAINSIINESSLTTDDIFYIKTVIEQINKNLQ